MRKFDPEKMIFVWGAESLCRVRACPVNSFFCGFAEDEEGFFLVKRCPCCGQEGKLTDAAKERIRIFDNILARECSRCKSTRFHGSGICLECGLKYGGEEE